MTGLLHYAGAFDASTGAFPANPTKGDFWKVSGAGVIDGTELSVGDQIIYSGSGWDKIDNTESVTSVAGMVGAVNLSVPNISGLSDDLASKAPLDSPAFTGPVTVTNNAFRVAGWGGTLTDGVVYFGAGDSYIYKSSTTWRFKNAELSTGDAVLDTTGTIWTAGNFNPATKSDTNHTHTNIYRLVDGESLGSGVSKQHTDWNSANTAGWWMASGAANAPTSDGAWYLGQVNIHNNAWITQEVWSFTSGAQPQPRYIRNCLSGTWGAWYRIDTVKTWVQSGDPGGAAKDGDLWVW